MRSAALLTCLFFGAAYLSAQTLPTTMETPAMNAETTTMQTAITSLASPQNAQLGAGATRVNARVSAEIDATVMAGASAVPNLNSNTLMPAMHLTATGSDLQGKSLGAGAAGQGTQLSAAIASRSSLVSSKIRQAMQKVATKGGSTGLTAKNSATNGYKSASASLTSPMDDLSSDGLSSDDLASMRSGVSIGPAGGGATAEGQFPDSTRGTGWPSPPEGATLVEFPVGGLDFQAPGGFMEETHLKLSLLNVTRGELHAEKRAARWRRMEQGQPQEEQPEEGPEQTLPGSLGTQNLTPSPVTRPQFSDLHSVYPSSDLQTSYPK